MSTLLKYPDHITPAKIRDIHFSWQTVNGVTPVGSYFHSMEHIYNSNASYYTVYIGSDFKTPLCYYTYENGAFILSVVKNDSIYKVAIEPIGLVHGELYMFYYILGEDITNKILYTLTYTLNNHIDRKILKQNDSHCD